MRHTFPSADKVGEFVVFNIAGSKYRLVVSIHFNRGKVYIRHVPTHQYLDLCDSGEIPSQIFPKSKARDNYQPFD